MLTLPGMAQTPTALPTNAQEFEKQVGITPDQHNKIEAVGNKYKPQIEKVQSKYKPQFAQLQQQMQALQQKYMGLQQKYVAEIKPIATQQQKDIDALLTPQQREKIKQINQAVQQQRAAMSAGGAGGAGQPMHP
jgi:hypothetical protein